jgi:hypothetical protein
MPGARCTRSPVGWVEPFAKPIIFANLQLMGIASLHPSYALTVCVGAMIHRILVFCD